MYRVGGRVARRVAISRRAPDRLRVRSRRAAVGSRTHGPPPGGSPPSELRLRDYVYRVVDSIPHQLTLRPTKLFLPFFRHLNEKLFLLASTQKENYLEGKCDLDKSCCTSTLKDVCVSCNGFREVGNQDSQSRGQTGPVYCRGVNRYANH